MKRLIVNTGDEQNRVDEIYKNNSIISFVEKTLISDCSLNASSLDQIEQLSFNASANRGISLSCGDKILACDSNSLKESLGAILSSSSSSESFLLNSSELIFAYFKTSDCFLNNSSLTCSGMKSSNLKELEEDIIKLAGLGLKNETNMFVSTTNSINYQLFCLYFFQADSLISSPILRASLSNSFSDSSCFRSCSFNANLCTCDSNNLLINADQFTSGNCPIFFLNSTGTDKVRFIVAILNDSCVIHNNSVNSHVYKSFAPDRAALQSLVEKEVRK